MIICPKCGESTLDARFCQHCGEPLNSCTSCGAKVSKGAKFCPHCGMELILVKTSAEGEVSPKAHARYGPSLISKNILLDGEVPLFETRPVLWLRLMPPIACFIIGIVILLSAYSYLHVGEILYGCGGVFLLGIMWALMVWLHWRYTVYAATSQRILRQTGIIFKSYIDCPHYSVQTIQLDISIWGRINGFGTIRVRGAGTQIEWENIDEPTEAHRLLNEIVAQYRKQAN